LAPIALAPVGCGARGIVYDVLSRYPLEKPSTILWVFNSVRLGAHGLSLPVLDSASSRIMGGPGAAAQCRPAGHTRSQQDIAVVGQRRAIAKMQLDMRRSGTAPVPRAGLVVGAWFFPSGLG